MLKVCFEISQVSNFRVDDASYEDEIFSTLMGDEVAPRKEFIEKYANTVQNLDI